MKQTIKFGKIRASIDPDRDSGKSGIYYGANYNRMLPGSKRQNVNPAISHGSCVN
jgi:hypothetical protein